MKAKRWTLMKSIIAFSVFSLALVAVLLYSTASTGKFAPIIPDDVFHNRVIGASGCIACHTPGKQVPLRDSHPPKTECFSCHKFK